MTRIAHVSDLHFGAEDTRVHAGLLRDLVRARPAAVVVSGDLTQRARPREFAAARRFLRQLPAPALVVPGNHDVAPLHRPLERLTAPFGEYQAHIAPDLEPTLHVDGLTLLGIRTPRALSISGGRVSRAQLARIRERLRALPPGGARLLVAHHPFLAPTWGRHHRLVRRGEEALSLLDACEVDLLMAGHFHVTFVRGTHAYPALRGRTLVVQAGTALSHRLRGEPNSYNLVELEGDEARVEVRVWEAGRFVAGNRDLFRRDGGGWRHTGGHSRSMAHLGG